MELLANRTGLLSRKSDIAKGVITLISTAEAIADELTLYRLNGLDDVGGAGICNVPLSPLRRGSVNEKLALTAIAGVGAKDGIGDHGRKAKEGVAAHAENNTSLPGGCSSLCCIP
jgi:hypothetical protein